jgi:threonine dehydratase
MIGVEPSVADDTRRSFAAGHPVRIAQPDTIADGLAVTAPGANTLAINRRLVADVVTVDDGQIVAAMATIADTLGILVEPSGAVGIAALEAGPDRWSGRIGVILSGGNVDRQRWGHLLPEV